MQRTRKSVAARPRTRTLLTPPEPCGSGTKKRRGPNGPPRFASDLANPTQLPRRLPAPCDLPRERPAAWGSPTASLRALDLPPAAIRSHARAECSAARQSGAFSAMSRRRRRQVRKARRTESPKEPMPGRIANRGAPPSSPVRVPSSAQERGRVPTGKAGRREGRSAFRPGRRARRGNLPGLAAGAGPLPKGYAVASRPRAAAPESLALAISAPGRPCDRPPGSVPRGRSPRAVRRFRVPAIRVRQSRSGRNRESKYSARFL